MGENLVNLCSLLFLMLVGMIFCWNRRCKELNKLKGNEKNKYLDG